MEKRCSFELFKSNVCHWLKEEGDIDFLIQVLESDLILKYCDTPTRVLANGRGSVTELEPIVKSEADVQETDF